MMKNVTENFDFEVRVMLVGVKSSKREIFEREIFLNHRTADHE